MKRRLSSISRDTSISMYTQALCGFTAGIVSKITTMPFDVIKKRFQVQDFHWEKDSYYQHKQPSMNKVIDCVKYIIKHEGVKGLFKGTVPSLLKAGPNSAIIYLVYEQTIHILNTYRHHREESKH